jgi:uncharacterized protein YrzB (UPF0473 family)
MSQEPEMQEQAQIITLEGDDGSSYSCEVIEVFDFEDKEYALLLNLDEKEEDDEDSEGALVVMRLIRQADQAVFQTIETEEEFQKVIEHVKTIVSEADDFGDEHEHEGGCCG